MSQELQTQQPQANKPFYWIIRHKPSWEGSKVKLYGPRSSFSALLPSIYEEILPGFPDATKAAFDRLRYITGSDQKCPTFERNGFEKFLCTNKDALNTLLMTWRDDDSALISKLPGKFFTALIRWAKLEEGEIPESAKGSNDYAEAYLGPTTEIQGIGSYKSFNSAQTKTQTKILDCWGREPGFHACPWEEIVSGKEWGLSASTNKVAIKVSVYIQDVEFS
ncbi:hypothetical protein IQ07DRAFT_602848 [Pyrenochaeta sp. DS3sAY3a]|nr:hypothetical protein IQ07DRAFT_602848 [Pyrenochaeta sp. DS3sAY3a]